MVVIDPRPTALALQADVWLQVRPGTDAALGLGLMRALITNAGYDQEFTSGWTNAPFLVRRDDGRLLRERCLRPDAPQDRCIVIDAHSGHARAADGPGDSTSVLDASIQITDARSGALVACDTVFRRLRQHVAPWTPQAVERVTGVAPELLARAAELMGGGRRMAYHAWTGVAQHTNATQTERCLATLYALNGSFDRIGGNRLRKGPPVNAPAPLSLLSESQRAKALGLDERPLGPPASGWVTTRDVFHAILEKKPYPVRALMGFGTNMPISQGDTLLAQQALAQLEFHVQLDLFETPMARYADILLPVNSPWEHEGLRVGFEISDAAASLVQLRQRMVSPRGESRSDNDIVFALACRLGMSQAFFGGSLEAAWNHQLAPSGLSVAQLRRQPAGIRLPIDAREQKYRRNEEASPAGFNTPSRRVALYSELLLQHGQPALPTYVPAAESRRAGGRFPLLLSNAKNGYYCHSQHRSLVSLRKRAPEPIAEISPSLAERKGIADGDWVRIQTRIGSARFVARLTPGLSDEVVFAEFGWWQACPEIDRVESAVGGAMGSNFNRLISAEDRDPVSGATAMRSFRCDIERDAATPLRQRKWQGQARFRVCRLEAEAQGVLAVHFEALDGRLLPDFLPGQHIQLSVNAHGRQISRAYSLTGKAQEDDRRSYSIAVRHQQGTDATGQPYEGQMSGYLHRHVALGQEVDLMAPSGNFIVPRASPQPLILLAGGIGITPFINLLESLPDGDAAEIWLYYANAHSGTHAFRERIQQHQQRLPRLTVVNHYRSPLAGDRRGQDYDSSERITPDCVAQALIDRRARVYMCGPQAMMDDFRGGLVARGMPKFDIFSEVFSSPPAAPVDDGRSFQVTFSRSGSQALVWTAAQGPLLAFAESHGLKPANGCRVGQCESCAVKIVSGKVRHLHGSEPEEPGTCLTCQAVPTEDLVLDL